MQCTLLFICVCSAQGLRRITPYFDPHANEPDFSYESVEANAVDALELEVEDELLETFQSSDKAMSLLETSQTKWLWDDIHGCVEDMKHKWHDKQNTNDVKCEDPWIKSKDCKAPYEMPGYRLGDLVLKDDKAHFGHGSVDRHVQRFPKSIAEQYWVRKDRKVDIDTLNSVVDSEEYKDFERPDNTTAVIQIRAFDALVSEQAGRHNHSAYYRWLASHLADQGYDKITLLTNDHKIRTIVDRLGSKGSSTSLFHKALEKHQRKMDTITTIFEKKGYKVEKRFNFNQDCDFIYMVNARCFVPAGGKLSEVVDLLVKKRGGKTIFNPDK